jgi:alpha-L-fucosidase
MFVHFGINSFTGREWGEGREDPRLFAPARLEARQWVRAAKAGGFRTVILTAKHHDGFCLWPTRTTDHSVRSSPWRGGEGDLVRELTDACKAEGLGAGLYLSPWDRHEPSYGDSRRYNDFYCDQLTELLTRYGPITEVWFDGANGEGPNGKRQVYDWPRFQGLVRTLQPQALMFSDAGPDIRWIGNERGVAGDPNWCTVNPATVPWPGASGDEVTQMLQHGDPDGSVWRPGEADVSIRPGWFWRPSEDDQVRSTENLLDLYLSSVGRNANLLLNVPPTNAGLLHDTDATRLAAFGARRSALLETDLARDTVVRASGERGRAASADRVLDPDPDSYWSPPDGTRGGWVELTFREPVRFGLVCLREAIAGGQRIASYTVQAWVDRSWLIVSRGTTIGNRKLDRCPPTQTSRVRLVVDSALDAPRVSGFALFDAP